MQIEHLDGPFLCIKQMVMLPCAESSIATWVKRRRCPSGANYLFQATCLNYLIFHLPSLCHYKPRETTEEMSTREHKLKKVVDQRLFYLRLYLTILKLYHFCER